jgi:hypothetical protein
VFLDSQQTVELLNEFCELVAIMLFRKPLTKNRHSLSLVGSHGLGKAIMYTKLLPLQAHWSKLTMYCTRDRRIIFPDMMNKERSPQQALTVPCPTCGAKPGEKCQLSTGQPRTDPHRDRRVIAKEQT